jgi:hypothetical protein
MQTTHAPKFRACPDPFLSLERPALYESLCSDHMTSRSAEVGVKAINRALAELGINGFEALVVTVSKA